MTIFIVFFFQLKTPKIRDIVASSRDTRDMVQNPGLSREIRDTWQARTEMVSGQRWLVYRGDEWAELVTGLKCWTDASSSS